MPDAAKKAPPQVEKFGVNKYELISHEWWRSKEEEDSEELVRKREEKDP